MTGSEPAGAPPSASYDDPPAGSATGPSAPAGPSGPADASGGPAAPADPPTGPADPRAAEVVRLRLVVARLYRQLAQASADDLDLTYAQLSALARVAALGPMRLGELAALEHAAAPSLTRTLRPLAAAGLLTKHADPTDRRSMLVSVTPEGTAHLERIRRESSELLARRMSRLTPEQHARLIAALPVLELLLTEADS